MLVLGSLAVNGFDASRSMIFDPNGSKSGFVGAIPNSRGHAVQPLFVRGEVKRKVFYTDKTKTRSGEFDSTFYNEGVIIETKANRLKFLERIRDASKPNRREQINTQISDFKRATRALDDWTPVSVWASDGQNLYASGPGIFDTESTVASDIDIAGLSVAKRLTAYFTLHIGDKAQSQVQKLLSNINFVKITELPNRAPNLEDTLECASFGVVMSQIRGYRTEGYDYAELGVEYQTVLNGLMNVYDGNVPLHKLSVDFTQFISGDMRERHILRKIGPYAACRVTPFVLDSSGSKLNNLAFVTLVTRPGLTIARQGASTVVRLNGDMLLLDIDFEIMNLMLSNVEAVNKIALRILQNAQTYSFATTGSSSWATSLYCDWRGLPGIIGALSFGI